MDDSPELEKQPLMKLAEEKIRKMAHENGYVYANILEDPEDEDIYLEEIHLVADSEEDELRYEINSEEIAIFIKDQEGKIKTYLIFQSGVVEQIIDSEGKINHQPVNTVGRNDLWSKIINSNANVGKNLEGFKRPSVPGDMRFWAHDRQGIPFELPFPEEN